MNPTALVRAAVPEEHKALCALARQGGEYTRDFSNMMFSGEHAYAKGWIRVAVAFSEDDAGDLLGLTCVRHKVRTPVTELYFVVVDPTWRGHGVGSLLLGDLQRQSPHRCIGLNCMQKNVRAVKFYQDLGFTIVGSALGDKAHRMQLEW